MAKPSLSAQSKGAAPASEQRQSQRRIMLVLACGVCLVAALSITAQQPARKAPSKAAARPNAEKAIAQTGFSPTTPAKEYIYAGGKLLATEEPMRFNDVAPGDLFYNDILRIAAREVTLGCGGGNYCPSGVPTGLVTREQMAAFIMRALGEHSPPPPATQRFADVPSSNPFYAYIERLAQLQITLGCGNGNYCPSSFVTHEQMAAFMERARPEHLPGWQPPTPTAQTFCDVPPSNQFYGHIKLYGSDHQVWLGCNNSAGSCPPNSGCQLPCFCPMENVTRAQMARSLVRNFNL